MSSVINKDTLRHKAKRIRAGALKFLGLGAAESATNHGHVLLSAFDKGTTIGAYWPIGDELDPRFLMLKLEQSGYKIALPVVTTENTPLTFRLWGQGDPLVAGPFKTRHPSDDAPEVTPDVLLAPLLAFDADCYRLGWGGGYYDRTLAANTNIKAFGFAYAAQFMDTVPHDPHDWPLQGVITEAGVILPKK